MSNMKLGDRVVFHPRPSDRIHKFPDQQRCVLTAVVAYVNEDGTLNLGGIDSMGIPFMVKNIPDETGAKEHDAFGGWCEVRK
jgi:hypothetical protein